MATPNLATQKATRQRRQAVEKEYLAGYKAAVIHLRLSGEFKVQPQTIRKDIMEVRRAWKEDIDEAEEFEGRHRYLAALREVRELAITGREEEGKFGPVIRGDDLALAHKIDKEIAQLSGVDLDMGSRIININLHAAIAHMEIVMQAVFSIVTEQDKQNLIIEAIEIAAE